MTLFDEDPTGADDLCGAGVWLLATSGPGPLDEYRAYRTHCQAAPGHPGVHGVRVAGEPDDATEPVQPVTVTWPNTGPPAGDGEHLPGQPPTELSELVELDRSTS